jgi:hypothetical protein
MTAIRYYQQRIDFSPEERQTILSHLEVSTIFWNFLVTTMRDISECFLNAAPGEFSQARLERCCMCVMKEALGEKSDLNQEPMLKRFTIPEEWLAYLPAFRSFPRHLLVNRLHDLVMSYVRARDRQRTNKELGLPNHVTLPGRKSGHSKQSIRFAPMYFSIRILPENEIGEIIIPDLNNLKIPLASFGRVDLSRVQSVTLSYQAGRPKDRFGPIPGNDLTVTLWMDAHFGPIPGNDVVDKYSE